MRKFQEYLKEEEETVNKFLSQYGLEDDWKKYQNKPKPIQAPAEQPKGWKADTNEAMRDINSVTKKCIDSTQRVNGFGIDDIDFEVISSEKTYTGVQMHLEAKGTAQAKSDEHIKKQLVNLMNGCKKSLSDKGIRLEMLYNRLDVSEAGTKKENNMDEPAAGLVRKLSFVCLCTALVKTA